MSFSGALVIVAGATLVGIATSASAPPRATLPGVRYAVDTTEIKAPATGIFSMFAGRIEFAGGRGRIDISSVAARPTRSINGATIGPPLAQVGDYYLFDSTGYILVRQDSRTFSSIAFTTSTYRHGNMREAWDDFFEFGPMQRADIAADDTARLLQHGAFTIRWHLDRELRAGPAEILSRGRTIVADAPRGEATIVRWMEVTAALATLRDSITPLDTDLRLTGVAMLPPQSSSASQTNLILLHPMSEITLADIDVARLVLPTGYAERPWPGFEHASHLPARTSDGAKHWQTLRAPGS